MPPSDAFDDADQLADPDGDTSDAGLVTMFRTLLRAELTGTRDGAVVSTLAASPGDRPGLLLALADAFWDDELVKWIAADRDRERRAHAIARAVAPPEPPGSDNAATVAKIRAFTDWSDFDYPLIIVPGYTPLGEKVAKRGVHDVTRRRLEMALADHRASRAPFVLVSGANVYPRGTPFYEAIEMRTELRDMGLDDDRIVTEPRARHTTTNLRNAGRFMRAHKLPRALIVTIGGGIAGSDVFGQDFYLANAGLSTFHRRCNIELGYKIGELRGVGDGRIDFVPSPDVARPSYRDPLDP